MTRYLVLASFTDQGIRNVKDTTKRAKAAREMGAAFGVDVTNVFWTLGKYDVVLTVEAQDDAAVTAFGLSVGAAGNVRTETLRAYNADEMDAILAKMR